jgi:hypothetical protein
VHIQPQYLAAIKVALANDSNYTPAADDPYYFGKEIGRQARLVLIADKLGEKELRDGMLDKLEEWLTPWMVGQNKDHFVYDRSWGGLCSLNGLKGVFWMTDFGNGWYNDHVRTEGESWWWLARLNLRVYGLLRSTSTTDTSCTPSRLWASTGRRSSRCTRRR